MTGGSSFSEVFLGDVKVADDLRVGAEGEGWNVALTMLSFERASSADGAGGVGGSWEQLRGLAEHLCRTDDPVIRQQLVSLYSRAQAATVTGERARGALQAGEDEGPGGSIGKLYWTITLARTSDAAAALLGPRLAADTGEWGTYAWGEHVLGAPGYRIAGGSDEIQRNIIGERVLGLPREPRPPPAPSKR